jgi:Divergent InlB B-repeat domain
MKSERIDGSPSHEHARARSQTLAHMRWVTRKVAAITFLGLATLAITPTQAATIVVNGSDDTIHAGNCTLRAAIASMNSAALQGACANTGAAFGSGDLITFAPSVTTVMLNDAAGNSLNISANTLVIDGAGSVTVERPVAAANLFRIFNHTGTGTLFLLGLTIRNGVTNVDDARGGGVFSAGRLSLQNSLLEANQTRGRSSGGGGAHAAGSIDVSNSRIRNNSTTGTTSPGGALFSFTNVLVDNSTIDGNETTGAGSNGGGIAAGNGVGEGLALTSSRLESNAVRNGTVSQTRGGGAISFGETRILNSIVANNSAGIGFSSGEGGGVFAFAHTTTVEQSTFAGNEAATGGALALFSSANATTITNATFVGNRANSPVTNGGLGGAIYNLSPLTIRNSTLAQNTTTGLGGGILNSNGSVTLQSTIVANSTSQSAASPAPNVDVHNTTGIVSLTGANNLVRVSANFTMPADTLTSDPLVAALSDNGCLAPAGASGTTQCSQTMLLGAGSPAINAGNNVAGVLYDQRGAGFPRVLGAAADMGAVESGGAAVTTWPINVTVSGAAGGGSVSCTPNPVPNGQNAACQPAPNPGYVFVAFSGDCAGATCSLTNVTAARNVTATFAAIAAANAAPVPTLGGAAMGLLALALFGIAHSRRARGSARMRANDGDRP